MSQRMPRGHRRPYSPLGFRLQAGRFGKSPLARRRSVTGELARTAPHTVSPALSVPAVPSYLATAPKRARVTYVFPMTSTLSAIFATGILVRARRTLTHDT